MIIEIKKLSATLLDDWLYFFDNIAFSDNDGWAGCYCNEKAAYDNVNFRLPSGMFDRMHKVKCITCFCIAPSARGKGIATKLLDKICEDAKRDKYDCIEAYPFDNEENNAYHGPTSMYVNRRIKVYESASEKDDSLHRDRWNYFDGFRLR